MSFEIPNPEDYDVSLEHGFLPSRPPQLTSLDLCYQPWIKIARSVPRLLERKRLRAIVDRLPTLSCDGLETTEQLRCAYSILAFICHAYIWGGDSPVDVVPHNIAIPFLSVCKSLDMPTVATYAAVVLWNFQTAFAAGQRTNLDSLETVTTFTGAVDESWFYLVSVTIEAQGAPLISTALEATRCAEEDQPSVVAMQLQRLAVGMEQMSRTLKRMYENCDPHFFYHKLRPFLAGSKNMAKSGLPYGVKFDDGTGMAPYVQFAGGSNAQSSLFQFLDIALGVEHRATGSSVKAPGKHAWRQSSPSLSSEGHYRRSCQAEPDYITEMRQYMPAPHRRFLEHFARAANIREFVDSNLQHETLVTSYNACVAGLVGFRNIHMQIVGRYIILHNQDQALVKSSRTFAGLPKNTNGTGGTALMPFLRQVRDETANACA